MFDPFLHRIQEPIYPGYLKGTTISEFNIRFTTVSDYAIQYLYLSSIVVPDIIEFLKKTIKVWIIEFQCTSLHTVSCRKFTRGLDYEENKCENPCQLTSFFLVLVWSKTYIDIQGTFLFLLYVAHLKYVRVKVPRYHKSVKNMIAGTAMTTLSIIKKFIARGLVSWRFHTASIKASHAILNAQSSGALYIKETFVQFYIPYHMTSINQHQRI